MPHGFGLSPEVLEVAEPEEQQAPPVEPFAQVPEVVEAPSITEIARQEDSDDFEIELPKTMPA